MPEFTFYKIVSKDENIKDCYVGKTKNFKNRISKHKNDYYNENRRSYNIKVYQYIRENGGINNFNFIEIEKGEYNDKDSFIKERYWIEELKATLNRQLPLRTKKEWDEDNIEKQKEYNKKNIEKIKEKRKEKIMCECGCEITKYNLITHKKSQKHIDLIS